MNKHRSNGIMWVDRDEAIAENWDVMVKLTEPFRGTHMKLSVEEIIIREFDRMVAVKVLGYDPLGFHLNAGGFLLRRYSTDISAAWEIMDRLKHLEPNLYWNDENHAWYLSFNKKDIGVLPCGETAPHAICLAALKAVE